MRASCGAIEGPSQSFLLLPCGPAEASKVRRKEVCVEMSGACTNLIVLHFDGRLKEEGGKGR